MIEKCNFFSCRQFGFIGDICEVFGFSLSTDKKRVLIARAAERGQEGHIAPWPQGFGGLIMGQGTNVPGPRRLGGLIKLLILFKIEIN